MKRTSRSVLFSIRPQIFGEDRTALFFAHEKCERLRLPGRRTRCVALHKHNCRIRFEADSGAATASPWFAQTYAESVVLRSPIRYEADLGPFVERALNKGTKMFAAVGPEAFALEAIIDQIMVKDGFDPARSRLTTSLETFADSIN